MGLTLHTFCSHGVVSKIKLSIRCYLVMNTRSCIESMSGKDAISHTEHCLTLGAIERKCDTVPYRPRMSLIWLLRTGHEGDLVKFIPKGNCVHSEMITWSSGPE